MYTYLALGDSYTIGELVPIRDSFPYQTARLLNEQGLAVADPVIVAQTGWTTDELAAAIREKHLTGTFSFVTLLIGVNNQYRGRSSENYKAEFSELLGQATGFAGGDPGKVWVLSIPDWGVTPFAEGKDRKQIAADIDLYNNINRQLTDTAGSHYLSITELTRANASRPGYLATDGLHPAEPEYADWAKQLAPLIIRELGI